MTDWKLISAEPPKASGKMILIGREGGSPASLPGYHFKKGDYLTAGPHGLSRFKAPTHWAVFPKPPGDKT